MRHVIIGAGAAGIMAAQTIRELKPDDDITIISSDSVVQSRCMLHKYICGERSEESLSFVAEDFFRTNRIEWLSGVTVEFVDVVDRRVIYENNYRNYDRLLVATGAQSTVFPVSGLKQCANVFGLRSLHDAKEVLRYANNSYNIIVVGAGLVGMDAAYAMAEMEKEPVIIETSNKILPYNLDEKTAGVYREKFEQAGCHFLLNQNVVDFVPGRKGTVKELILSDGTAVPCDMVIVATGVRSALEFLKGSGVKWNQAGIVNRYLETNIEGVFVAGDAAGLSGVWPNARKQGEVAAKNMCGIRTKYTETFSRKNNINFYGVLSQSMGRLEVEAGDRVIVREDRNKYQKFIMRGTVLAGVILQGDITNGGLWQFLIKHEVDLKDIPKPVWDITYADFYKLNEEAEYRWKRPTRLL